MELSHVDENGNANMVDVSDKKITERIAEAMAYVHMKPETLKLIMENGMKKGDVLAVAKTAGIMAAKNTSSLIPLCHFIPLTKVEVRIEPEGADKLLVRSFVKCIYQTGVEMEALVAVQAAALTIYDMCKAVDRSMSIEQVVLLKKDGGRSGLYLRNESPRVTKLFLRPVKRQALLSLSVMHIDECGVEGFTEGNRAVSLLDSAAVVEMEEKQYQGFCMKKFYGNLVTDGLNYARLNIGDILTIGDVQLKITEIGKPCFEECEILKAGQVCSLKSGCAFAKVVRKGIISRGDTIELKEPANER